MKENKQKFSDKALKNLRELSQAVYRIFDFACEYLSNPSEELYRTIDDMEAGIDRLVDKMRASNTKRLSKMKCEATQGLYFSEILVDLERVADHALNIAQATKKYAIYDEEEE
jgi:phosphate:Na+ symporter